MKREVITTNDGSKTIHLPDWNESYHSKHGAVQEAQHVFIKSGLDEIKKPEVTILEVGFGTGLNAMLTLSKAIETNQVIHYSGLEAYPVSIDELKDLKYDTLPEIKENVNLFWEIHSSKWNEPNEVTPTFTLNKIQTFLKEFNPTENIYDLVYFDAFGPRVQPEMWTLEIFKKLYTSLKKEGVFVTYCAKGQVRRDLIEAGFQVEKIPGPPGKREMLRGRKI
jgi:tRNA U34 5-methylaminomethyl-2-thiouridine-forming methyltransferase MnmC